jgi:hypothetical protein
MVLRQALCILAILLIGPWAMPLLAEEPNPIPPDQFRKLHDLIKPQTDESSWAQIPWMTDLWEARRKAAAEGKPMLIWMASGHPLSQC